MKLFVFEYLFFRSVRRVKAWFNRAQIIRYFNSANTLRAASLVILTLNIIIFNPPVGSPPGEKTTLGRVLSETASEPKVPQPVRLSQAEPFEGFMGKAVLVVDAPTLAVLLEKESQTPFPFASLTKMMTALLVLERESLDGVVTVSLGCTKVAGLKVGFIERQEFRVEDMLYALLLPSASDAACVLSQSLTTPKEATPGADFVDLMNAKAQKLGLINTHFTNPVGLDASGNNHYSTAADLLVLTRTALSNPNFREMVKTKSRQIRPINGQVVYNLKTTNDLLLLDEGFKGVKTGYTNKALGCLSFLYEREGREVVGIILGSPDRFGDARKIIDWVFKSYRWQEPP